MRVFFNGISVRFCIFECATKKRRANCLWLLVSTYEVSLCSWVDSFFPIAKLLNVVFSVLCRYGIFWFFGGWVLVMSVAVYFYLPETKGVPLERMGEVWAKHWYWRSWCLGTDVTNGSPESKPSSVVDANSPSLEEL